LLLNGKDTNFNQSEVFKLFYFVVVYIVLMFKKTKMQFNFDNSYLTVPAELYSECRPAIVREPQLVVFNHDLATELGIETTTIQPDELSKVFGGNKLPDGAACIAQAYSGHQFGHFTRLGDGRAVMLGEQITPAGNRFDIQFKGSGVTPYSRRGDGRATLSAMMREYLISEAMHAMGIPTSRSLAVVVTGETVYREQLQLGAVLTRVAASHIRVGTFEHVAHFCSPETLKTYTNYVIIRHFPELSETENPALSLLGKVMEQQTDLIVNWMRVGFIHGVMNTDNMTISGETIDYGPCAFMNGYNPETVFSSIDTGGRYSFGNQPQMALWNLTRLAESLLPLIDNDTQIAIEKAEELLNTFQPSFEKKHYTMLGRKIGIYSLEKEDILLINNLLNWMYLNNADYTNTFLRLMYPELVTDKIYTETSFLEWQHDLKNRLSNSKQTKVSALALMQLTNPVYIPRNQKVEQVLNDVIEIGQLGPFEAYLKQLSTPYISSNIDKNLLQPPTQNADQGYKTFCGT